MREMTDGLIHTYGLKFDGQPARCPACSEQARRAETCSQLVYSATFLRFWLHHEEEFGSAALDARGGRATLERLEREWQIVQQRPRHYCVCDLKRCPFNGFGSKGCTPCIEQHAEKLVPGLDVAGEIGRSGSPAHAPMPAVELLDVARARKAGCVTSPQIAAYLNGTSSLRRVA